MDLFDFNNIAIAQSNMATKTDDDVIEEVVEVAKSSGRKKKTRNNKVVAGQMSFF